MTKKDKPNKVLLEIAKGDLESSMLLYEGKKFPQAFFFFQQAVEKITKFIGVDTGVIKVNDLQKKISHNSPSIYIKAIKTFTTPGKQIKDSELDKQFQSILNFIDNNPDDLVLHGILDQIKTTLESPLDLPFDPDKIKTSKDFYNILKVLQPNHKDTERFKTISENKSFAGKLDELVKKFSNQLKDYLQSIIILFMIDCLVFRHFKHLRYPDISEMENPALKYDENNPVIDTLPLLHKILESCIESIEDFKI